MNPEEKANELLSKYTELIGGPKVTIQACALITICEIQKQDYTVGSNLDQSFEILQYWEKVKDQINKFV
jgi:hypothetical protein